MSTHSWAFHPLCAHDFDNETLSIKLNALYMTSDLHRSIPIHTKTRNLSSHTTCSPTPAAVAWRPHAAAAMWPWRLTFWPPGQCMPSDAIYTVYVYQAWFW